LRTILSKEGGVEPHITGSSTSNPASSPATSPYSTTRARNNKPPDFQQNWSLTAAPNIEESRGDGSSTRDSLALMLTSYDNQEKVIKTQENQAKTRKGHTDTGDRTTVEQQTLTNLLSQELGHWDPTKAENGISLHGPCSLGPRTSLIIHQETTDTTPRSCG
jgi:hypothetical protein